MEKIPSFLKDHDNIIPGFYVSVIDKDLTTFDMRFVKPNGGKYLSVAAMHTIEHLLATTLRNGNLKNNVVYFGPMGCRTGFYLIMRDTDTKTAKQYLLSCAKLSLSFTEVPGSDRKSCGNYLEHSLSPALYHLKRYIKVLER